MNLNPNSSLGLIFVTLLIKLGAVSLLAAFIARFGIFRRLLMVEQRTPRQKLQLAAFLGVPFMLGVLARLLAQYRGVDLSLEVTVLAGLLGGTIVGLVGGMVVSLPALLIPLAMAHGKSEFVAVFLGVFFAATPRTARVGFPDKEEISEISPPLVLNPPPSLQPRLTHPPTDLARALFPLLCHPATHPRL